MPARIRPATEEDCPQIAAITNAEILGGVAHFAVAPDDPAEVARWWREHHEVYPWLVAEDGARPGEVVGFARASSWKTREAYDWTCETGIYVAGGCRGGGIGRALYEALFAELERRGFRCVIAGVTIPNPASERLHLAMGMAEAGTLERVGFKHGAWRGVRYYTKTLGDGSAPGPSPVSRRVGR